MEVEMKDRRKRNIPSKGRPGKVVIKGGGYKAKDENQCWECSRCHRINSPDVKVCPCSVPNKEMDSTGDFGKLMPIRIDYDQDKDRANHMPNEYKEL